MAQEARLGRSAAQIRQYRQNAPIVVFGGLQIKSEEDRRRVLGHGAFGNDEPLGEGCIGPTLGHESNHLAPVTVTKGLTTRLQVECG
jgi:hypothetical protein